jgi:tripartite-type tricarboxylate transporter receptor subunit TctC
LGRNGYAPAEAITPASAAPYSVIGKTTSGHALAKGRHDPMPREKFMPDRRKLLALTALSALAAPAILRGAISPAVAQAPWPNRQIRMVIPWPPGQATDVVGRLAGQRLQERLGQVVVPENRPCAGGQIGTDLVAKAPPDGNVILSASIGPISFSPLVQRTPYDPERELAPVVIFGIAPFMLLVKPDFPAQDLRSFMALVKANPGRYSYNSSGIGGAQHLVCALFLAISGRM